uniref:Ig-like domain-containing protein n=1 Tax=Nothobranchius furzeri TaxID=105023 RepID=A0A1A7ZVH7_NOTFU
MFLFTGPAVLLLMTLGLLSAEEKDYLAVVYPQSTTTTAVGSSAKLSCVANYDTEKCGMVHVIWHKMHELDDKSIELKHPWKYLTTVSETIIENTVRKRHVVTEITKAEEADDGRYQCKAECESGAQAMGHFITIKVQGIKTE